MEALESVNLALQSAQSELASAEIGLVEATARAEAARLEQRKLKAAVAALSGEPPPAVAQQVVPSGTVTASNPVEAGSIPAQPPNPERQIIHDMTPEEFDADRKRRQRAREKEVQAQNPYANLKCNGCGELGKLSDTVMQAPGGAPIRMMVCGGCGNQIIQ